MNATAELRVPRRKVVSFFKDFVGITWQPFYISLECGHKTGGTHRQAHAKAIECWKCYEQAKHSQRDGEVK